MEIRYMGDAMASPKEFLPDTRVHEGLNKLPLKQKETN
jgi:hypothetical protein